MRTIRRKNWFLRRIALGFAVAAFLAPAAQARMDESSIVQAHTYQPVHAQSYQAFISDLPSVQTPSGGPSPHDPALTRGGISSVVNANKPPLLGGAVARGDTQVSPGVVSSILGDQPSTAGFDGGDAGIGAGLALLLVLLGGGAAIATRQSGREQTA